MYRHKPVLDVGAEWTKERALEGLVLGALAKVAGDTVHSRRLASKLCEQQLFRLVTSVREGRRGPLC